MGAPVGELGDGALDPAAMRARPIPRISIQAFCENGATAEIIQIASEDRRLAKTHVSVHMGGIEAAVAHYQQNPTPNLIIIESSLPRDHDPGRARSAGRELRPGHEGDGHRPRQRRDALPRAAEARRQRVSRRAHRSAAADGGISNLYNNPETEPVGHVYAFIGAKGGVGSSTICHNAAWTLVGDPQDRRRHRRSRSGFRHDRPRFQPGSRCRASPMRCRSPDRLDEVLLDRLLTKCSEHLSIFAAPVVLDRDYDISAGRLRQVIDVVRQNVPYVAVDLPHTWTAWSKSILLQADEVIITAAPDLANLRNAKNIVDLLQQSRQQRQQAAPRHEHGQHAEAAGDQRQGIRDRRSASRPSRSSTSTARRSVRPPTTAR